MGIGKNRVFDSVQLQNLMVQTKTLMNKADSIVGEIYNNLKQISVTLKKVPSDIRDTTLVEKVDSLKASIKTDDFKNYSTYLTKQLTNIKKEIPSGDKRLGEKVSNIAGIMDMMTNRINALKELIPKGADSGKYEDFKKEFDKCTMAWKAIDEDVKELIEKILASLKGGKNEAVCYSDDPVNLCTGNFIYTKTDIRIYGKPGISFSRFYNEIDKRKGVFGRGWRHTYEVSVISDQTECTVILEDGKEEHFESTGDGIFTNRATCNQFEASENGYTYNTGQGYTYKFDKEGKYIEWKDNKGNELSICYEDKKLVKVLRKADGAYLDFKYDKDGILVSISDHERRKVLYEYNEDGYLSSVKNAAGEVHCYSYDENNRISAIINANGVATVENQYDSKGRTILQKFPDGGWMSYEYDDKEKKVILRERNGSNTAYYHNDRFHHISTSQEYGVEKFLYNQRGQKIMYQDFLGNITRYAYDNRGNITQIIDALGSKSNMTYNKENQLLKYIVDGVTQIKNTYDKQGDLIESQDSLGYITTFTYSGKGRVAEIKKPDGAVTQFTYNDQGNITTIIDPFGVQTSYTYDKLNRITTVIGSQGGKTHYSYDGMNRITAITNALGEMTRYEYNQNGKLKRIQYPDDSSECTEYNEMNLPIQKIDRDGNITNYEYDNMWNINKICKANGGIKIYSYDMHNRLTSITNELGNRREFDYDANGNCIMQRDALGGEIHYEYDKLNRPICIRDQENNKMFFVYDNAGNVIEQSDFAGNVTKYCYNAGGKKICKIDSKGNKTRYEYTALGKIERVISPTGKVTKYNYELGGRLKSISHIDGTEEKFSYDKEGNVSSYKKSDGTVQLFTHDALNRVIKMQYGQGQVKRYSYNAAGKVIKTIDAKENVTNYEYTHGGNLSKVMNADGSCTDYTYDALNNLIKVCQYVGTDGSNGECQTILYERNLLGKVEKIIDSLGYTESFSYDANGQLVQKLDKDGFQTKYKYSARGLLTSILYDDERQDNYSYNALGNLISIQDITGITKMNYDSLGRVNQIQYPDGNTLCYTWGMNGEKESMIYPDGKTVNYGYDQNLRLSQLEADNTVINYQYDAQGRLHKKVFPNGVESKYVYDNNGRVIELLHKDKEGVLDTFQFKYDALGNKVQLNRQRRGSGPNCTCVEYKYDELGRLLEVAKDEQVQTVYKYDSLGNRIYMKEDGKESIYEYNKMNQLVQRKEQFDSKIQNTTYKYDKRGNLVETQRDGELRNQYSYGPYNRLEKVYNELGDICTYKYNGLGVRVGKNILRHDNNESKKISYTVDLMRSHNNLIQVKEDGKKQEYFWDENAVYFNEDGNKKYYLQDELGSPIRLLDQQGNILESYDYDEFGNEVNSAQKSSQLFGFTGYQKDNITRTLFAQSREYIPEVGRFASKDNDIFIKINQPMSYNQYLYCYNNPNTYIDLDGYDSYVFYDPTNFTSAAESEKERLEDEYDTPVHFIPISNNEEFKKKWNEIDDNDIDEVSMLFHGQPHALIINEDENSCLTTNPSGYTNSGKKAVYIGDLAKHDAIKKINIMSCNVGHVDHKNNVASTFLKTQNVKEVSGWDGSIVYNKQFGFRDWGFGRYVPGLAGSQHYFYSWVRRKMSFLMFSWKRGPYGNVGYHYNENGDIVIDVWIDGIKMELNYTDCYDGYDQGCCGEGE